MVISRELPLKSEPDFLIFKVGDEIYGCVGAFIDMPGVFVEYVLVRIQDF